MAHPADAPETRPVIRRFDTLDGDDVPLVGGKNASLGEMIGALKEEVIRVPDGFATTAATYRRFLDANDLTDELRAQLAAWTAGEQSLSETGTAIRTQIRQGTFPPGVAEAIREAYQALSAAYGADAVDVAVRSSATAEDLPDASFAGQQESYLDVRGANAVLAACKRCFASLFTDRAIGYREKQGFDHHRVALSIGIQKMVRADTSGVLFTLDTETGFPHTRKRGEGPRHPGPVHGVRPLHGRRLAHAHPRKDKGRPDEKDCLYGRGRHGHRRNDGGGANSLCAVRRRDSGADPVGPHHRVALRAAHGRGVGARPRDRPAVCGAGPPRNGAVAAGRRDAAHPAPPACSAA
jgi:hypothetical protein